MPTDMTSPVLPSFGRSIGSDQSSLDPGTALAPAELALALLTTFIGVLAFVLSKLFHQDVAWGNFLISFAPAIGLILIGCHLRHHKHMPRMGVTAISAGIYIGFSGVITILIYLRFPIEVPLIDSQLMKFDARYFGYNWATITSALAQFPILGKVLGWIYGTSLLQLFAILFVLGAAGRVVELHRVLLCGTLSLLIAVAIWWVWPSVGPSAYVTLPADVEQALGLVHGQTAGAHLMHMVQSGSPVISPEIIMGTIAFPSYHTVMLCMAVVFSYGTWAFWPLAVLNMGMLPSILTHGGHHLTDMIGGFLVFGTAYWIGVFLIPRPDAQQREHSA